MDDDRSRSNSGRRAASSTPLLLRPSEPLGIPQAVAPVVAAAVAVVAAAVAVSVDVAPVVDAAVVDILLFCYFFFFLFC